MEKTSACLAMIYITIIFCEKYLYRVFDEIVKIFGEFSDFSALSNKTPPIKIIVKFI
jgi:hypothetical protein